jgi:hypothetical protein
VHWVRSMLDVYQVGGDEWPAILDLCRESRQRGWWRAYGVGDDSYVGFETEATGILDFTLTYIPGLLQTAEYCRALLQTGLRRRTRQQLTDAVAVRTIRQQRLTSTEHPLTLAAVIDENALHRTIGNSRVQAAQLQHLVQAAELATVTLQILPASLHGHAAMISPFTILQFDSIGEPDIAYVEHSLGSMIIDKKSDVANARLLFDRLRSAALSPADSVTVISQLAERT